jgi:hypothetical protein
MLNFVKCEYLPEGYLINQFGEIKNPKGKILKQSKSNSGYKCINIKNKGYFIHRALAFAFINQVKGKEFVNHKDADKSNNQISNLEWCTKSENVKHMYDLGIKKYKPLHYKGKFGSDHNRSKKVVCITDGKIFGSMSEAERFYNFGGGAVSWSVKNEKPIYGKHFEIAK